MPKTAEEPQDNLPLQTSHGKLYEAEVEDKKPSVRLPRDDMVWRFVLGVFWALGLSFSCSGPQQHFLASSSHTRGTHAT